MMLHEALIPRIIKIMPLKVMLKMKKDVSIYIRDYANLRAYSKFGFAN